MKVSFDTPVARSLLDRSQSILHELIQEIILICEIPAPTFAEQQRTAYIYRRMTEIGLKEVLCDEIGNVFGRLRGAGSGPTVLVAAHIDTVFPIDTPIKVQPDGGILRAPGVGDNSASVAAMLRTAQLFSESEAELGGDIIFAATVGEEGLGNLRGIRATLERFGTEVDYVIAVDGSLGSLVREGVGSRRFCLRVTAEGGHSWGAFGSPSAIHSLGQMIAEISTIQVPVRPKTTFNVGTISGGTSVNTIAAHAEAMIDLRSIDAAELRRLEERIFQITAAVARRIGVHAEMILMGDRPTGAIAEDHPLCHAVYEVHRHLGIQTRSYPSSTDGNIPLSLGIPSVTVGVTLGGNGHRTDEYIYTTPLVRGLGQMMLLLLAAQQLPVRVR